MNGYTFRAEYADPSRTLLSGNVLALDTEPGTTSPLRTPGYGYSASGALFFRPNSGVTSANPSRAYLDTCKRVSEAAARRIHPRLFAFIDRFDLDGNETGHPAAPQGDPEELYRPRLVSFVETDGPDDRDPVFFVVDPEGVLNEQIAGLRATEEEAVKAAANLAAGTRHPFDAMTIEYGSPSLGSNGPGSVQVSTAGRVLATFSRTAPQAA